MNVIGLTQIFIDELCQQDSHTKAFRWYWFRRGIEIKRNGQRFNARGMSIKRGLTLEQAAREYGR